MMKTELQDHTVRISAVRELAAANATAFRDKVCEALTQDCRNIDIDLSETSLLDSSGLGTLIELQRAAGTRNGTLRLLNAPAPIRQILELTRMDNVFQIVDERSIEH